MGAPYLLVTLTFLTAYLIGAIPFGYLIARSRGVDILRQGSGNIGATNVGRILGPAFGILVFVLDFAQGSGAGGGCGLDCRSSGFRAAKG
jgi:glycerol-3-phosphate acyltransferase PlsY